jgi:transcriptional regulator with XRE-family HTH domain
MLRHWRDLRGTSQLELSSHTGVSQRHISFIESGRSSPSRQTLMDIAQALDVPLRDRNSLLLAAGYAPVYSAAPWNAAEMQGVTRALERMLRQHEPFPAVVMDRYWNVLVTNEAAPRFFNSFIDMKKRTGLRNMLHLMFDPDGMPTTRRRLGPGRAYADPPDSSRIGRACHGFEDSGVDHGDTELPGY